MRKIKFQKKNKHHWYRLLRMRCVNEAKGIQLKIPIGRAYKTQATVVPRVQTRLQKSLNRCQDLKMAWSADGNESRWNENWLDLNVDVTGLASVMEKQVSLSPQDNKSSSSLDVLIVGGPYISTFKDFRCHTSVPGLSDHPRMSFTVLSAVAHVHVQYCVAPLKLIQNN